MLEHFLKLAFSPAAAPLAGWRRSILDARTELADDLTASLRADVVASFATLYAQARKAAAIDLEGAGEKEAARRLAETCPWTLDDVLRDDWHPEAAADQGTVSG